MEKKRLKNDMLRKIKETKLSLLAMTEDQLHTTTKRTIMENEQMTIELQFQSKETERVLKLNNKYLKENKALKRQLELHLQAEDMLDARGKKFQLQITNLNEKLAIQHKQKMLDNAKTVTVDPKQALLESEEVIAQLELRTRDLENLVRAAQEETMIVESQLQDTEVATKSMLGLQEEALTFLLMCVEDVKSNYEPAEPRHAPLLPDIRDKGAGKGSPGQMTTTAQRGQEPIFLQELNTPDEREVFVELLAQKLNTFTPQQISVLTQH